MKQGGGGSSGKTTVILTKVRIQGYGVLRCLALDPDFRQDDGAKGHGSANITTHQNVTPTRALSVWPLSLPT